MARIRMIKPEFWTDDEVGKLDPLARLSRLRRPGWLSRPQCPTGLLPRLSGGAEGRGAAATAPAPAKEVARKDSNGWP